MVTVSLAFLGLRRLKTVRKDEDDIDVAVHALLEPCTCTPPLKARHSPMHSVLNRQALRLVSFQSSLVPVVVYGVAAPILETLDSLVCDRERRSQG